MSIFMQIDGIQGEVSDQNHKNWIDVLELDWRVARKITSNPSTQRDRESSNAIVSDLTFMKFMDIATVGLFAAACCGRGKTIIIEMTKTGKGQGADTYLQYTLENALISSIETEALSYDDIRPLEIITISFTGIKKKYTSYDDDGNILTSQVVGFDTTTNSKY